jgi:hypothetical protein
MKAAIIKEDLIKNTEMIANHSKRIINASKTNRMMMMSFKSLMKLKESTLVEEVSKEVLVPIRKVPTLTILLPRQPMHHRPLPSNNHLPPLHLLRLPFLLLSSLPLTYRVGASQMSLLRRLLSQLRLKTTTSKLLSLRHLSPRKRSRQ